MSLATPMTSVGMSRSGERPLMRPSGGRYDAGLSGADRESAVLSRLVLWDDDDEDDSGCSW